MRPPKATLLRARDIFRKIGDRVMQAMVRHPTCWMPGIVEHCSENQKLLDDWISSQGLVREHAVITYCGAKLAERGKQHRQSQHLEARQRKQNQSDDAKNVNQD